VGPSLALLANAEAGGADEDALAAADALWRESGADVHRLDPTRDGWVQSVQALRPSRLVVAGGDGSIHHCLTALHRAGCLRRWPVAVMPMGTGNDLARTLGMPDDPVAAAELALHGMPRGTDVLRDDQSTIVVNAAHVGVGALASERAHAVKGLLGPLAYPVGAVLAGARAAAWPMRVVVYGDEVADGSEPLLMVGLAMGRTIGGGAPLAPEASLHDARVDVVLVSATGPIARLDVARRLRAGTHDELDDVAVLQARDVLLEAGDAPLNVDGELLGDAGTRRWRVLPHAWQAVVPAPP
jgi:YegS/Rv2252/BmrU family lipid kinase